MALLLLALLTAEPHSALVIPERLRDLDQKAARVARDIAKEDRLYHQMDTRFEKLRSQPDSGVKEPNKNLAEWDDQKAELARLHSALDDEAAAVRALKDSKEGVTVDAARAEGDRLDALEKRVLDLRERLDRLIHAVQQPAK